MLTDALWALSYMSDGDNARVQAVLEAGICRLVSCGAIIVSVVWPIDQPGTAWLISLQSVVAGATAIAIHGYDRRSGVNA